MRSYDQVRVWSEGDSSVGIDGNYADIDVRINLLTKEEREAFRQNLIQTFSELWDQEAYVMFDFEQAEYLK